MTASPVFLFSPLVVQKVECLTENELRLKMANLINLKGFCPQLAMLPGLSSFVMLKEIVSPTRQSLLSLSLTVAKRSVESVPFGTLALRVICHKVSSPSSFFFIYGNHFTIEGCQKATF